MLCRSLLVVLLWPASSTLLAQTEWEVRPVVEGLRIDGHLEDWQGVPVLELSPSSAPRSTENFGKDDLDLKVRLLWDKDSLYVALEWQDDIRDIKEVRRQDAIFVTSDGTRRDRMYFYDNLKFSIRQSDYDFTLWLSPRYAGDGPHTWQRLLQGYRGMEAAVSAPLITARENGQTVTMELRFQWDQLRLKGKKNKTYPLTLIVADSDLPGQLLEYKAGRPKWLMWQGTLRLVE